MPKKTKPLIESLYESLSGRYVVVNTTILASNTTDEGMVGQLSYEGFYLGRDDKFTFLGRFVQEEGDKVGVFEITNVINNSVIVTIEVKDNNDLDQNLDIQIADTSIN
jgi:hypothetical protein